MWKARFSTIQGQREREGQGGEKTESAYGKDENNTGKLFTMLNSVELKARTSGKACTHVLEI